MISRILGDAEKKASEMRAAAEAIEPTVQRMMMRSLCDEMEKEWVKRNNGH